MKNLVSLGYFNCLNAAISHELDQLERVERVVEFIVNRKIKYDRLLHGITPEGVKQLYDSVKKRVEKKLQEKTFPFLA